MYEKRGTKETTWEMNKAVFTAVSLPDLPDALAADDDVTGHTQLQDLGRADTRKLAMTLLLELGRQSSHTLRSQLREMTQPTADSYRETSDSIRVEISMSNSIRVG
jgi:hypothetical protein